MFRSKLSLRLTDFVAVSLWWCVVWACDWVCDSLTVWLWACDGVCCDWVCDSLIVWLWLCELVRLWWCLCVLWLWASEPLGLWWCLCVLWLWGCDAVWDDRACVSDAVGLWLVSRTRDVGWLLRRWMADFVNSLVVYFFNTCVVVWNWNVNSSSSQVWLWLWVHSLCFVSLTGQNCSRNSVEMRVWNQKWHIFSHLMNDRFGHPDIRVRTSDIRVRVRVQSRCPN